jgi:hypothetical protein
MLAFQLRGVQAPPRFFMTSSSTPAEVKKPRSRHPEEPVDDTQYESAFKPLMWLLVPFVLLLIYGYFN